MIQKRVHSGRLDKRQLFIILFSIVQLGKMAEYNVSEIAQIIGRSLVKNDLVIRNILFDSRKIISSGDSVFFAIHGDRHNGHDFINELYEKGIRTFVVSDENTFADIYPEANFILVKDSLVALQTLAAWHRKKFNIPVIGITGSNGKTIVKEWLYHVLALEKNIVRSPKSFNSQIGVPLSLWLMNRDNELGIFEAGISKPGEMKKLGNIILPDTGIFTNIGEAHQENFSTLKQKAEEKLKLFYSCKRIIYCKDHDVVHEAIQSCKDLENAELFSWSVKEKANLQILNIQRENRKSKIQADYSGKRVSINIPFTDDASVENAIHIWAYLLQTGQFSERSAEQFRTLPPVAMRLELKKGKNNCTIINDSYNSDINSLSIALDMLNMQSQHSRKSVILSDMFQTGIEEQVLYNKISKLLSQKDLTSFIGIGSALSRNQEIFRIPSQFFATTEEFLNKISEINFQHEAILIKGSRPFQFEKISAALEEKKHRTRLEINLNALVENLNFYRSLLNENTKIMVMVKALSYGSGSYEIATILQYQRVDYLGVAIADEGVELRNAGINIPIIVMNPEPESFDLMIHHRLEPEIYGFSILHAFNQAVLRNQEIGYPVHLKIDSRMHRLGFQEKQIDDVIFFLNSNRNLMVKSVFSHLAASDEPPHDAFTREQISLFTRIADKIQNELPNPFIRHILNSSGIERFPEAQFGMVRLGIGLYGYSPFNASKLRNVSSLKSTLLQIKKVDTDETIGYGRAGKSGEGKIIGIIPIGYADGLDRRLGNGVGKVLINHKFVPFVGNICMDMCMVDLNGIEAHEGDEVLIFGDEYPMQKLAEQLKTIPYEILTGVSERVKRIYYHE